MLTLLADLNAPAAVFLAASLGGAVAVPYYLTVDAQPCDFDPRPLARRALESGRFDWLLIAVAGVRFHAPRHAAPRNPLARRTAREAALTAAALLALLLPAHGGTR